MGMPGWWGERRFGLYLDVSLATVPAWAPIGAPANRYRHHIGEQAPRAPETPGPLVPGPLVPGPLVEVLAHHRDRWGHIDRYDDFAPLLTFERFDAEEWTSLAARAGAGYVVLAARHHDGWCWWDAPATDRRLFDVGPGRNVLAELVAACGRDGLVAGGFYSLEDLDRLGDDVDAVAAAIGAQLGDLVERRGLDLLCGDGGHRREEMPALATSITERLARRGVVLDRSLAALTAGPEGPSWPVDRLVTTICDDLPLDVIEEPWQLCRPIGRGTGHNRTETEAHQMDAAEIVTLLSEVVAKGGNLMLAIGPAADGTIPEMQRRPLLDAAPWIRRHRRLLAGARPWSAWGDEDTRYWLVDDVLHAVDVSGSGRFVALDAAAYVIDGVTRVAGDEPHASIDDAPADLLVEFTQDDEGVHLQGRRPSALDRATRSADPAVYRIDVRPRARAVELFAPSPPAPLPLGPLVEGALAGEIVQLGDGVYLGPARLPSGVTMRGLGPDRTTIDTTDGPLTVGEHARLEHLTVAAADAVASDEPLTTGAEPPTSVRVVGDAATILGCRIDELAVEGHDAVIRATALRHLRAVDADRLLVSRSRFVGDRSATAITITGGADHTVDSCEFSGHRCAIRVTEASGVAVAGNHIECRWWGVHLERTDRAHVHRNLMIATMRAVDVDGGSFALIDGNAVFDGDSGCIVQRGATGCEISGNHWERCRIGVLGWEVGEVREVDNHAVDLHEPDNRVVLGP